MCLISTLNATELQPPNEDNNDRPNILLIIADDLSAEALSCYGNENCLTPNIDRLANDGMLWTNAHCQFPICAPSRAALMSSLYPRANGVVGNGSANRLTDTLGDRPTLPQFLIQNGYYSARVSKIYHMRVPGDITAGVDGPDHFASWTERFNFQGPEWMSSGEHSHLSNERLRRDPDVHYNLGFGGAFYVVKGDTDGSEQPDVRATDKAIELMAMDRDEPFFIGVGLVRPHVPLVAPAAYYEPYPVDEMILPEKLDGDWDDIPQQGISKNSRGIGVEGNLQRQQEILSAYYASVAFVDAQVGRLLDALDELDLDENTIVLFMSDHGYHLGEHDFWQKSSLHEESVRIPLMMAGPSIPAHTTDQLAQQIDIYPTLCELIDLQRPEHCQGRSLVPQFDDPQAAVHDAVFSMKGNADLIRTLEWAYIRYASGDRELYDQVNDPQQYSNLVNDADSQAIVEHLDDLLDQHLSQFE